MQRRLMIAGLILAIALAILPGVAAAIPTNAPPPPREKEHPLVPVIAAFFGIEEDTVLSLREHNWGFGEILLANFFAQVSGEDLDNIVSLRNEGKGWGQIMADLDFHPFRLAWRFGQFLEQNRGLQHSPHGG